jgi:hypothetical protein
MALRLDKAFGGGADTWLRLQMAYDLAQARLHEGQIKVSNLYRGVSGMSRVSLSLVLHEDKHVTMTRVVSPGRSSPA